MHAWKPAGLLCFLLAGLASIAPARIRAQTETPAQVVDLRASYTFGGEIVLQGRVISANPPVQAAAILRFEGQPGEVEIPANLEPGGVLQAAYSLADHPVRVFSDIAYRFKVTLANGESLSSPETVLYYEDNRFQWQKRVEAPFEVYWYEGDEAFAGEVLAAARAGLARAGELLPLESPDAVKIYVYGDPQAMQTALLLSGQSWVAGHAHAELRAMQVSLPPGPEQSLEMQRQVPHELMHLLLYQADPAGYASLPAWFNEGLASIAELSPNPDYQVLLENAYSKGTLLPLDSLCQVFPRDANGALLAYAQSASFTRSLYDRFGRDGLERLHAQYAAGAGCESGLEGALGSSLAVQENRWRQGAFAENPWLTALEGLLPWLALLALASAGPLILAARALRRRPAAPAA
jgi:hypothetical protein